MEQIELFLIESPCKGVCENSKKGFCKGCLRSRDERFHWFSLSNEARYHILDLCKHRRLRLIKARQERAEADSIKVLPYGMEDEPLADLFELEKTVFTNG